MHITDESAYQLIEQVLAGRIPLDVAARAATNAVGTMSRFYRLVDDYTSEIPPGVTDVTGVDDPGGKISLPGLKGRTFGIGYAVHAGHLMIEMESIEGPEPMYWWADLETGEPVDAETARQIDEYIDAGHEAQIAERAAGWDPNP